MLTRLRLKGAKSLDCILSVSLGLILCLCLKKKNKLFFKQKYFIKQTENSIKEILTSGKQNSVSDEIQKKHTAGSWKIQKDTASAKSLNPIFSVMKSKTQRKLIFFTKKFHQQYDIPEGHCQCQVSEPLFLCDKVQNTEIFFIFT